EDGVVVTLVTEDERADVTKMTRKAGVEVVGVEVRPGHHALAEITGARKPSGIALPAPTPPAGSGAGRGEGSGQRRTPSRRGRSAGRSGAAAGSHADRPAAGGRSGGKPATARTDGSASAPR